MTSTATAMSPITDHVYRRYHSGGRPYSRDGTRGGPAIAEHMCCYLGTCNRPSGEHPNPSQYRRARAGRRRP